MNRFGIFELHARVVELQVRKLRIDNERFRMPQRAVHRDLAFRAPVTLEFIDVQRARQKRIEIDILDRHFSVEIERIRQSQIDRARQFAAAIHRRTQRQSRAFAI